MEERKKRRKGGLRHLRPHHFVPFMSVMLAHSARVCLLVGLFVGCLLACLLACLLVCWLLACLLACLLVGWLVGWFCLFVFCSSPDRCSTGPGVEVKAKRVADIAFRSSAGEINPLTIIRPQGINNLKLKPNSTHQKAFIQQVYVINYKC